MTGSAGGSGGYSTPEVVFNAVMLNKTSWKGRLNITNYHISDHYPEILNGHCLTSQLSKGKELCDIGKLYQNLTN